MSSIEPGAPVIVRTADGEELPKRAVTTVIDGADFPVVWVTSEEEWHEAQENGQRPEARPWPVEDVQPAHVSTTT